MGVGEEREKREMCVCVGGKGGGGGGGEGGKIEQTDVHRVKKIQVG